ncbi:DUF4240 domain-containing protein [Dactylosporangium sp. NPDC005555]|uniref:DUF4240 domain-containing protein n=1 Tax=Dactylosporangium sp. NPDC005555 TaxID=3154889 RepID=UPI0033B6E4E4
MDAERCWEIVEAARSEAGTDWNNLDERLGAALLDQLVRLPLTEIVEFEVQFDFMQYHAARDDLFMAAFLIHNGCGDDSFSDFCAGVVGLGRKWYERALTDPDNLAEHPAVEGVAAGAVNISVLLTEDFQFAPLRAWRQVTGDDGGYYEALDRLEPAVAADNPSVVVPVLPRRLERLAAMFPGQHAALDLFYPHLTGASDPPAGSGEDNPQP